MQQLSVLSESVNIQDSLKKASILLPLCVAVILVGWRVVFTLITAPPTGGERGPRSVSRGVSSDNSSFQLTWENLLEKFRV